MFANRVHRLSQNGAKSLVRISCASVNPTTFFSELELNPNEASDAPRNGPGTVCFDEISELDAACQRNLLGALPDGDLGARRGVLRARLISTTNRNLDEEMRAGRFRSELYYRISGVCLRLPPLRDRKEDIPLLVEYFIDRFARNAGKNIRGVSKKTLDLLQAYPWPGNIRELQNVIERSVIVCETENFSVDESWLSREPLAREASSPLDLAEKLAVQEKEMIEAALRECAGRVFGPSGAAVMLGMPRSTLESKIRSLKINKNRFRTSGSEEEN